VYLFFKAPSYKFPGAVTKGLFNDWTDVGDAARWIEKENNVIEVLDYSQ